MGDANRRPITERQAKARRENGKKSRGPVTEEGKRRSSMNSVQHGYWVKSVQPINRGPLQEDKDVMERFVGAVIEDLAPGDSVLLQQSARDVAHKMWRQIRAQLWESEGFSAPASHSDGPWQLDWLAHTAAQHRKGAEVIRSLPVPSSSIGQLWHALMPLAIELKVPDEELENLGDGDIAQFLEELIDNHFESLEDAASLLDSKAEEAESEASQIGAATRPTVIREELDGSFAKNSERILSHAGRELDRSLERYWELRERLQMTQASVEPGEAQSDRASEPSDRPDAPPPPPRSTPVGDSEEVKSDDLTSLLDRILGITKEV